MKHKKIKAKGHYTYEYISKVKGQGRQYPHTADLDLGPGSGLRKIFVFLLIYHESGGLLGLI